MKIATVFALTFLTSLMLALGQESDEGNAVLQTERDLATAYLKSDADGIAQGVMEDYTLTNSMGKITTRTDDIAEAKKTILNTKSSRTTT
jgi:ketosteroid isomerase-like protein